MNASYDNEHDNNNNKKPDLTTLVYKEKEYKEKIRQFPVNFIDDQ